MRLISWNIHKGIGGRDRKYSLQRIIDCIEVENPDLICLQEVDRLVHRSHFDDQPRLLAHYFHYHSIFQPTVHVGVGTYGNLLLSRWPIESRHRITLQQGLRKSRGAQLVLIDSPEGLLHVVHTHLGLNERERHWQIERLLGHMLFRSADHLATLIVGDFNDWRNTLADKALHENGFAQITAPIKNFRSFPAWLAIGSLDKAFMRGAIEIKQARIIKTSLSKSASDHLPLVIDLHLH
jgi:endonuclease/exonuclease/phosphatase family metal-dependent hydrolase